MRERPVIAIDGPSGAGKTTVAGILAERLSLLRIDTGAMYRACALAAHRAGISWDDAERLASLCRSLPLAFRREGTEVRVLLGEEDVSAAIRTPEIGRGASRVSRHEAVREAMVTLQRDMGKEGGVVAEGRDIGTVVFPDADLKVFLDAVAAVRAQRRFLEWMRGERLRDNDRRGDKAIGFEEVLLDVLRRDVQDSIRDHAPLRMAEGAVYIDTTTLPVDEVVEEILRRLPGPDGAAVAESRRCC
jgi:CMP/dCMP kinase